MEIYSGTILGVRYQKSVAPGKICYMSLRALRPPECHHISWLGDAPSSLSLHGLPGIYVYSLVLNLIKTDLHEMNSEHTINPGGSYSESFKITTPTKTSFENKVLFTGLGPGHIFWWPACNPSYQWSLCSPSQYQIRSKNSSDSNPVPFLASRSYIL